MSRIKIYISFIVLAVIYLFGHHYIMDDHFHWTGVKNFFIEAKAHVWHVAPILILFFALLIKDLRDRYKKIGPYATQKQNDTQGN